MMRFGPAQAHPFDLRNALGALATANTSSPPADRITQPVPHSRAVGCHAPVGKPYHQICAPQLAIAEEPQPLS